MSDIVIKAENIGKKYTIGHQSENGRYLALRDVVMQNARSFWRVTKDLVRGRPIILGDNLEEVWALRDVSFEIRRGEAVGIIGRNGAGKSTLLKILSRITEPSAGRVTLKGRVASLLEVGTGFHPELTGRENIYLNGAVLGMTRAEVKRKFDEIVDFSGVEKFLDTPVKRFSSGMYVRLAFAVAAHLEPEILVVDEVLAVGDAEFQKKCLEKMGDVAEQGRTVLFVSHNMNAILNLCRSAVLLVSGRIAEQGEVQQVISQYLTTDQECNVFRPRVKERLGDQHAYIDGFEIQPKQPRTGSPLELSVDIVRPSSSMGTIAVEIAVTFLTDQGVKILQLYSRHMDVSFSLLEGSQRVIIRVDSLPLVAGNYWVNLWMGSNKNLFDWLPECMLLSVSPGKLNGNSFADNRGYPVVIPAHWQHQI